MPARETRRAGDRAVPTEPREGFQSAYSDTLKAGETGDPQRLGGHWYFVSLKS